MKIALVVHDYHRAGGHSRYVAELAAHFSVQNEVHIFANTFSPATDNKVHFHHVPAWRRTALTTILTFLPGTRNIRQQFDIVHNQGFCNVQSDVTTTHICNRAWFNARKRIEKKLPWKDYVFDAVVSPLEKRLYSNPESRVIAVSKRVKQDLAGSYGRTANVDVIYHGVNAVQFNPSNREVWSGPLRLELGLSKADFVFLFVGDLRKGATVIIEALGQVPKCKMVFVSRTPLEPYAQIAKRFGVHDRVIFCSATSQIERYYAASDAFVFPTPYDAFGMVIAEAMGSALPVITSREAGAAEWITNGQDGILLDKTTDAIELARLMTLLAEDPTIRRSMGEAARAVVERHSWDAVARQTMEVYEKAAANRRT
jgi:glycosyltransferase involved in cell wall biosynthesis